MVCEVGSLPEALVFWRKTLEKGGSLLSKVSMLASTLGSNYATSHLYF